MMINKFVKSKLLKLNYRNEGLSLIEVLISIALIGIMAVSFLAIFTNNFFAVFSMGRKTEAVAANQKVMELFYSGTEISVIDEIIANELPNTEYSLTDGVGAEGTDLVVVTTFYNNGNRNVKLSAYVPFP